MMFKDPTRHHAEWWQLDPRLRQIVTEVEVAAYPMPMTITGLMRTEAEQLILYEAERARLISEGKDPSLAISKKTSVHQFGRGADVRPFPDEKFNAWLVKDINDRFQYDSNRPDKVTVIRHEGTKDHLHFQCIALREFIKSFQRAVV